RAVRISTWQTYEQHVRLHIRPYLGAVEIGHVDGPTVKDWLRDLKRDKRSVAMLDKCLTSLGTACKWAIGEGYIRTNPTEGITTPTRPKLEIPTSSNETTGRLIEAIRGHRLEATLLPRVHYGSAAR